MTEPFFTTSRTPLAFFDPESSCWRMSQPTLLSVVPESLEHLPDWGTTSDGELYVLPTPERLTAVLDDGVLLPTPRAQNGEDRNMKPWRRPLNEPQNLENALARLSGIVTNQRSDGGSESSGDESLLQSPTDGSTPPLWNG